MATRQTNGRRTEPPRGKPASTLQEWENELIGDAYMLAQQQFRDGTASAQVTTHFLKLGSSREKLEQQRLAMEVELMEAKKEAMAAEARIEDLYNNAIEAMRSYKGQAPSDLDDDDPYD